MSPRSTAWGAYAQIANALRERIRTGALSAGELLPSEVALAQEYGVVRNTLRRALAQLEQEGLIESLPGRGRMVRPPEQRSTAPVQPKPARYREIAAELRAAIERGDLSEGAALPSEAALTTQYGVSRGTARQALADLSGAGLVESVQGKGWFVRSR
ncbi:GntR family transcriptional regulator [Streptomyces sp. PTM05]|uniref:GntR family transcriptional regulator n=1 Tax=Streptantibioticus parmotrematis TaxID=2873249 RepID=A0ABS7QZ84_9ACTN|nr:GntR family transcriptional regulator [Streptantibioticus parmotrematis]MBY8888519.1 GntR family transcriptional regulator [Streptantibioticus parmotrematis]